MIYNVDYNVANSLKLLHKGRLDVRICNRLLHTDAPDGTDRSEIRDMISDRAAVFVGHVSPLSIAPTVNLEHVAGALGYRRETLRTIADSHGRLIFDIFHFRPNGL